VDGFLELAAEDIGFNFQLNMRLFESIIDANHRAVAGDASAGLHPAEFVDALAFLTGTVYFLPDSL
jgi:hypothetical protein